MALRLARKAEGRTSPNPIVGAVLVRDGRIVGVGYHQFAGGDHAEIAALKRARKKHGAQPFTLRWSPAVTMAVHRLVPKL